MFPDEKMQESLLINFNAPSLTASRLAHSVVSYDVGTGTLTLASSIPAVRRTGSSRTMSTTDDAPTRLAHVQADMLLDAEYGTPAAAPRTSSVAGASDAERRQRDALFAEGAWVNIIGYVSAMPPAWRSADPSRESDVDWQVDEVFVEGVLIWEARGMEVGTERYEEAVRARREALG